MARVALVCEPPDGGVAEHVLELALGLPAHGWEPVVFGPAEFAPLGRLRAGDGRFEELDFCRDYRHPHRDAASLASLARALGGEGFDLVHAHAAKAGVIGRAAAKVRRLPSVYTPHCFPFVGEISTKRRLFATAVERALAPATDAIVCVCEAEREDARRRSLRPRELVVVLNGCPECDDGAPPPEVDELRGGGLLVGAISVLRRQKGLDVFLDAVPRVLARSADARVVLVGDGPEREPLEAQVRDLGLDREPRFRFLHYAPPAKRYLRALDVFVLSSSWEAFPIAVLEAQACGVPQVATDVGGTHEAVVPETGILVPPHDPERLAAAIGELLDDPARRAAMADASRARHAELFSAEQMVAGTAAVYERVLQRRGA